jgi:hypothetical protein
MDHSESEGPAERTHLETRAEGAFKTFPVWSDIGKQINRPAGGIPFSEAVLVILTLPELDVSFPLADLARGVFGRIDPGSVENPEFDLTKYEAQEKGVSRRHAALCREQGTLLLCDLDSKNGTYINGQRIAPHLPCPVYDGDEIRLARLVLLVSFQPDISPS